LLFPRNHHRTTADNESVGLAAKSPTATAGLFCNPADLSAENAGCINDASGGKQREGDQS
jgi:hypothetical protein